MLKSIILMFVFVLLPHQPTADESTSNIVDFMIQHTIEDYVVVFDSGSTDLVNEQIITQHNPVTRQIYAVEKLTPPPLAEFCNLPTLAETAVQWFVIAVQSTRKAMTTIVTSHITMLVQHVNRNRNACFLFIIDSALLSDAAHEFLVYVLNQTTPVKSVVYLSPVRRFQCVHLDGAAILTSVCLDPNQTHDTITFTALLDFVSVHIVAPHSLVHSRRPDAEQFRVQGEELWLADLLARMLNLRARHVVLHPSLSLWFAEKSRITQRNQQIYAHLLARVRPHLPQYRSRLHRSYDIANNSAHIHLDMVYLQRGFRSLYPHRSIAIVLIVPNDRLYSVRVDTLAIGALVLLVYPLVVARLRLAAQSTSPHRRKRHRFQRLWLDTFRMLLAGSTAVPGRTAAIDSALWLGTAVLALLNGTIVCCYLFEANAFGARFVYDRLDDVLRDRLPICGHAIYRDLFAVQANGDGRWRELTAPQVLDWLCADGGDGALVFTDVGYALLDCMYGIQYRRSRELPVSLAEQRLALAIAAPAAVELGARLKVAVLRAVQYGFVDWYNRCNWQMVGGWQRLQARRRDQRRLGRGGVVAEQTASGQWQLMLTVLAVGAAAAGAVFGVERRMGRRV